MSANRPPLNADSTSDQRCDSAVDPDTSVPAFLTREWVSDDGIPTEPPFYHEADEGTWARRVNPSLENPHRDERVLRALYVEDDLSDAAIGRVLGVAQSTVNTHRRRAGIESTIQRATSFPVAEDHDRLRELYIEQELSSYQIAARDDVRASRRKVYDELVRAGIERRGRGGKRNDVSRYVIRTNRDREYAIYKIGSSADPDGPIEVTGHALAALGDGHNPYDVFGGSDAWLKTARAAGTPDVTVERDLDAPTIDNHHDNRMTLDNRPVNIRPLPHAEHSRHHKPYQDTPIVYRDAARAHEIGAVDEQGRTVIPVDEFGTPLACPIPGAAAQSPEDETGSADESLDLVTAD